MTSKFGALIAKRLPGTLSGNEIKSRVKGKPKFLFGLANDELGYIVPPEFFYDPKYAYECSMSPGPQAASEITIKIEKLVRALDN